MNRFIRFEYSVKDLQSINDYKHQPISALKSTLKPILSHVERLDYYIQKAKKYRHYPSEHDLNKNESGAIYLYSDDWGEQSFNWILNRRLQSDDRTTLMPWLGFLKLFNTALKKLPTIKDTIWRGLPIAVANKLKENDEFVLSCITSCSSSVSVIVQFLDKTSILCSIKPLNAKDIRGYTTYDNDDEVLLLPGTRLRVKSKKSNVREGEVAIYLEEISGIDDEQSIPDDTETSDVSKSTDERDISKFNYPAVKLTIVSKVKDDESIPINQESKENEMKAVITFSNGDQYEVVYQNGKKQDYRKYYSTNGEKFEGQEADDKATGEGICAFSNGDRYIGTFQCGNKHGHGILCHVNDSIKAGNWINDEPPNQSLQIQSGNNRYEWRVENNPKQFYGAYFSDNGNKYIGSVVNGKAHGLGLRIWSDRSRYEGNFRKDKKHGFGVYHYSDRDKYMGHWAYDEIHGEGELKWKSGTSYKGNFRNGKRYGQGKLNFSNGAMQQGNWENDEYIS